MTEAEAMGRAFYLAMYEKDGARWEANDEKLLWMRKAQRYHELLVSTSSKEPELPKARPMGQS